MLLSVLIPAYNRDCSELVRRLGRSVMCANADAVELLVLEDGSDNETAIAANVAAVTEYPFARHLRVGRNTGRAAARNRLARESCGRWLLYVDSGVLPGAESFVGAYLSALHEAEADEVKLVTGGVNVLPGGEGCSLRYRYEYAARRLQTVAFRRRHPYRSFRTTNFCILRELLLEQPFDERFIHYGYEDVLFGQMMETLGVRVSAIDNPVDYSVYDTDAAFVIKMEQASGTLREYCAELSGYSGLIAAENALLRLGLLRPVHRFFMPRLAAMRRRILSRRVPLLYYKVYRLAHYLCLGVPRCS